MVRCPKHPDVMLDKTMSGATRIRGVWFPGFICPVCGKTYTYEEYLMEAKKISREEAKRRMVNEAERIGGGASSIFTLSPEEIRETLGELVRQQIRELIKNEVREIIREELTRLGFKESGMCEKGSST